MREERVIIYISATKQTTTAKWHLEGMYPSDLWIAVLHDIADLKPFLGESKVRIRFRDRTRETMFCFWNEKLIQAGQNELDFWIGKECKESEGKSMLHNVTVKVEENKVLETYWTIRGNIKGNSFLRPYHELDHEPTPEEIAQFIYRNKVDFAFVEKDYRFASELPFC